MVFSDKNKILYLYQLKGYKAIELTNEFSKVDKTSNSRLLIKFRDTGAVNRLKGSGARRSASTEENDDLVNDLVLSQKDTPQQANSQNGS